jgi:hypothetical protein
LNYRVGVKAWINHGGFACVFVGYDVREVVAVTFNLLKEHVDSLPLFFATCACG